MGSSQDQGTSVTQDEGSGPELGGHTNENLGRNRGSEAASDSGGGEAANYALEEDHGRHGQDAVCERYTVQALVDKAEDVLEAARVDEENADTNIAAAKAELEAAKSVK